MKQGAERTAVQVEIYECPVTLYLHALQLFSTFYNPLQLQVAILENPAVESHICPQLQLILQFVYCCPKCSFLWILQPCHAAVYVHLIVGNLHILHTIQLALSDKKYQLKRYTSFLFLENLWKQDMTESMQHIKYNGASRFAF